MLSRDRLAVGAVVVVSALISPLAVAGADTQVEDPNKSAAVIRSAASDGADVSGFLDMAYASVRTGSHDVLVRFRTYQPWQKSWLTKCRGFLIGWFDDQVRVRVRTTDARGLHAVIEQAERGKISRVRAHHPRPRAVTFSMPTAKLDVVDGKWRVVSMSTRQPGTRCSGNTIIDQVPDDGLVVP